MKMDTTGAGPDAVNRRIRRLKAVGVAVLLLGGSSAGLVYWLGTRASDVKDDLSMAGFNRAEQRQMGQLYGKMGLLLEQWGDDLKQPGTQAILIVMVSVLITAVCFYFARLSVNDKADGSSRSE